MAKKSKNAKQRIKVRGLPASKRKMAAKDMKKAQKVVATLNAPTDAMAAALSTLGP